MNQNSKFQKTPSTAATEAGSPALSRRDFHRLLAGAGLAVGGLAAGGTLALPGRARAADINLTVFEWSGYDDPSLFPEFVKKYGGQPNFAIFAEEEEAYQKLRAGFKVDLAHPCTLSVGRWRDAGLLKPIDTSRIARWKDIPTDMLAAKGIMADGKTWFMPFDWGNSTIIYREDELPKAEQSYKLLLDPKLKGKVSMFDSVDEAFVFASGVLGYKSHMDLTDDQIQKCAEVLRQLHKNVRFYWSDPTALQQAMAAGEVTAAWAWTDSYLALKGEKVDVKFMFPKEGLSTWMCGMVMLKDAPGNLDQAYDYLNAMLDPQVGKVLIDDWGYGHSNRNSYKLATSELAKQLGLTSDLDKFLKGTRYQGEIPPEKREKMIDIFEQVKLGG
ncbi:putative spermidine/putrescine transport system substrate-binding protein/spermidine/putrescine transport system substrate-binding protein [Tistlia consotensis]|uniref:Putative spermidine/putrescine transport system substrate-binding protein/spermidine/putrescine transport system substrate-binding protein n=1 Tax=Tistlia consotensis USBA 355 TaxID=560819 RepID=A0A1Y6BKB7_9PROT|nr:extracellular solute-binding protein [Tistlia consotensis]SMF13893.1 putative spermidine/putrescine transport system substrate-binding protein/spermidine/putrescine transport system substrate-binding protein [Tistlia consotensis USBA 355]SNR50083.1 putative spermidine/putrescine transport system substrate-binding protein/spermidine/putrescine transport system substrate-binding protein [Tistlia consotensis]